MFRGLINDAKSAVSSLILTYLARASVAVPFLIALGFALAAITAMLINRLGYVAAYWLMAGGLALVGVVAAVIVSLREQEESAADQKAEEADASDMAAEVAKQAPLALLGGLFAAPGGAASALKVAQVLARNLPLVLLIVLIAALFLPAEEGSETAEETEPLPKRPRPDGFEPPSPGAYTH